MSKRIWMAGVLALMFAAGTAMAGDLVNKDSTKYDFKISCGGGTTSASISGKTTQSGRVKAGCVIELGGEKYTVKSDGDVTIENGKLSE